MNAYENAVDEHQRQVFTFARYWLRDAHEAEDVTQEVLLRLWRHWRELDGQRISAWLVRVTRNACIDRMRARRARPETTVERFPASTAARGSDPEGSTHAGELRSRVSAALQELEEPYKSVVILREIEGMKYREISEALDLPLNTVKVYLHRGRLRLRERLREVYAGA